MHQVCVGEIKALGQLVYVAAHSVMCVMACLVFWFGRCHGLSFLAGCRTVSHSVTYLEAHFHGCLCNGQVSPPNIVQRDLLLPNGSKQPLHLVLEAHRVHIQCSVQMTDALLSQPC